MHTAEDKFVCHAFLCEPSSGALCKTIEAACKVNNFFNIWYIFIRKQIQNFKPKTLS